MNALDVIRTKRDRGELTDAQIRFFIDGYTAGRIPDEQTSALLMAIVFVGLTPRELATWTAAMIESGSRLDLSSLTRPTVDKHSTGGVGDKVSLPLCPLVAACGAAVPQLSGRGLGHTGGTLDKLEAIPGAGRLVPFRQSELAPLRSWIGPRKPLLIRCAPADRVVQPDLSPRASEWSWRWASLRKRCGRSAWR